MMEPDTYLGTPRRYFSPASDEDGSEAHATVRSDFLNVARICHVQTAENRFGADIGPEIRSFIHESWNSGVGMDDGPPEGDVAEQVPVVDEVDTVQLMQEGLDLPNGGMTPLPPALPDAGPLFPVMPPPGLAPPVYLPIGLQAPAVPGDDMVMQLQLMEQQNQQQQNQQQQNQQPQQDVQLVQQQIQMIQQEEQMQEDERGRENGQQRFPRAQRLRLNLTALSQKYNLYFASYQNRIHVFIPRKVPNILPRPCLVLTPKKLKIARRVRPAINQSFGHQMNHLMIGNLGHLEVLFFAFDDGDVGAYYTHTIAHYILSASRQREAKGKLPLTSVEPKEFFHENVGDSAWGLAIHQESRLLAVSSNKAEVTVFAFALHQDQTRQLKDLSFDPSPELWPGQTALGLEREFRTRTRTWKIILPLDHRGSNIPNISFCDDEQGCAEFVVAQDIKQRTWFLDIWRMGYPPVDIMHETINMNYATAEGIGWGVMVLPDNCFKKTSSLHECLGLPAEEISAGTLRKAAFWLDTTSSLARVRDLANPLSYFLRAPHCPSFVDPKRIARFPIEEDLNEEGGADEETDISDVTKLWTNVDFGLFDRRSLILTDKLPRFRPVPWDYLEDTHYGIHQAQFIVPRFAHIPDASSVGRETYARWRSPAVPFHKCDFFPRYATKNISILLTSSTDVCLIHMDSKGTPVLCKEILPLHNHLNRDPSPYDLHRNISLRIGMLLHVPELNLVVLGSLCGRVALLRLTKTAKLFYGAPVRRGFRVEAVLPRWLEEHKRMRPWCTLHGIAISPIPGPRTDGISLHGQGDESQGPARKKWRLVLHYLDHTILTYIITRPEDGEDLLVV